jgi:hypothetical protein
MTVATPSAAALKTRYPVFATVADALVDAVIAESVPAVTDEWAATDQTPGILAFAAHLLAAEGYETQTVGVGGAGDMTITGPVEMVRVGDTTVKLQSNTAGAGGGSGGGATADDLASTTFGRYYLTLRRRNIAAVLVV